MVRIGFFKEEVAGREGLDFSIMGGESREFALNQALVGVRIVPDYQNASYSVVSTSSSPRLKSHEVMAAVAQMGGRVSDISVAKNSQHGTEELVVSAPDVSKFREVPLTQNIFITRIGTFGWAKLYAVAGSNMAVLTSEDNGKLLRLRRVLSDDQIVAANAMLKDKGITVKKSVPISQFENAGDMRPETLALVL